MKGTFSSDVSFTATNRGKNWTKVVVMQRHLTLNREQWNREPEQLQYF
jgi:hypothetical protein